jgi:hypothetical protein
MRRSSSLISALVGTYLALGVLNVANAQCALPYTLTNGQPPDATQVMANFNALVSCLNPGGSTNAIQYNNGGSLAGVGPLTNGQLLIGSTGNPPQAATLTAGSGITITTGPGSVTVAATAGTAGTGLYRQVMSATPTSFSTGLTNWLNQGTATVSDSAVGISINAPTSSTGNVIGRYMTAPSTPYTITALIAATRNNSAFSAVGIGWFDGTNKLHLIEYVINSGAAPLFQVQKWNTPTSFNSSDFQSALNSFSQPVWLQLHDDGANVSFAFSQDGANFLTVFSVAKSSGFLGASGYSNLIFAVNPQGANATLGTLLSWTKS